MSNKGKIVWLRILHSVICLIIAFFGPVFTYKFIYNSLIHYAKEGRLFDLLVFEIYFIVTFVVLIVIPCTKGEITKKFLIAMICVSSIIIIPYVITCNLGSCLAIFTMLPLYWLVSRAIDKWINKLKIE